MNIKLYPYQLEFVFPFRIAHGVRTHTDAVFVELECDGVRAFGEATLPPYLPYTQRSTMDSISKFDFSKVTFPYKTNELMPSLGIMPSTIEAPAFAAIDMALWMLEAKSKNTTIRNLLGIYQPDTAIRTYTISVCDKGEMAERIAYGKESGFDTFKLKFNGVDDRRMLSDFRSLSNVPFAVDANQSWSDWDMIMSFCDELKAAGCILVEEPYSKDFRQRYMMRIHQFFGVEKQTLSLPIIADESCQNYNGLSSLKYFGYSGVNIKLQKCGGIHQAMRMIKYAKGHDLKLLIGCMSESIIGCSAGEVLSPFCDWNDLDGSYLVKEVPFSNL